MLRKKGVPTALPLVTGVRAVGRVSARGPAAASRIQVRLLADPQCRCSYPALVTPNPAPVPAHDLQAVYSDEVVAGSTIDVGRWRSWTTQAHGEAVDYYAQGPCPGCAAPAQGHAADRLAPLEGQGDTADLPPSAPRPTATEPIEVPVQCLCGAEHGRSGAHGCGRRWSVLVPRSTL